MGDVHVRVKGDDVEAVVFVEPLDDVAGRLFRLLYLFACHAAGGVQHQHHVLGRHLLGVDIDLGRDQEEEVAGLVVRAVRRQAHPDLIVGGREQQLEVRARDHVGELHTDGGLVIAVPLDRRVVAGRVDGADGLRRFDFDGDGDFGDGLGGELLSAQRVDEAHQAVLPLQELGVADLDASLAVGRDGEDVGLEHPAVDVLQQGGVALAADDLLVDAAGLVPVQQAALKLLSVNEHGEVGDGGVLGEGEDVGGFQRRVSRVLERLVDLYLGDLVADGDFDSMVLDGKEGDEAAEWTTGTRAGFWRRAGSIRDNDAVRADLHGGGDDRSSDGPGECDEA